LRSGWVDDRRFRRLQAISKLAVCLLAELRRQLRNFLSEGQIIPIRGGAALDWPVSARFWYLTRAGPPQRPSFW